MRDDLQELKRRLATAEADRDRLAATPAVDAAIASVGVRPGLRIAVRALFLSRRVELDDDGDCFIDGAPADAAVRAWAATSEGIAHIGGDREGSGASAHATKRRRSEMTTAQKGSYVAKHGLAAYEALPK